MAATAVGPRELYDAYARPFEAAIRLGGLGGVMASYSEFEGVPIHTSRAVLTDLLRGRMGFTGTVVSDYNGIGLAQTRQLVASTPEEVGALGVAAGMDVECPAVHGYGKLLVAAVENGKLSEDQLNESVRRVLRDKPSACATTPMSARTRSRSTPARRRATTCPVGWPPSRSPCSRTTAASCPSVAT